MKLSERFDRRYQQTPLAPAAQPVARPAPADGAPPVAPVERRAVPRESGDPVTAQLKVMGADGTDQQTQLSPALAAAKAEIHALLL